VKNPISLLPLAAALIGLTAPAAFPGAAAGLPPGHGAAGAAPHGAATLPGTGGPQGTKGKVVETIDVANYTYVQVDDGKEKVWAAAPTFSVAVGDDVVVPPGSLMKDFHSTKLSRTFETIYFVDSIEVISRKHTNGKPGAAHSAPAAVAPIEPGKLAKPEDGHTIAELFANKATLAGREVAVRGQVVKFNKNILGKNWIHLQDGSGNADSNDLTVTTKGQASVGDTVLVRGKLGTDKDLGYGYKYEVIVEDAAVTVE
jgi:hypothetical protein